MKLGLIKHGFTQGGIERVVIQLLPLFKKAGHDVVLFSEFSQESDVYDNVPEHKRIVVGSGVDRSEKLKKALEKEQVDLCILEDHWISTFVEDCAVLKLLRLPYVVHFHTVFSEFYLSPELWRNERDHYSACIQASAVITLSQCDEYYFRSIGCNAYYFPNPTVDVPAGLIKEPVRHSILWVARFASAKHPEDALKIFEKVLMRIPDATLTMVGGLDTPEAAEIQHEIQANPKLQASVRLPGFSSDVWKYYLKSSIFLSTSSHEGFSCTFMEAGAARIPIVGYDLPYIETVKGNLGFVPVKMGDIDAAAEAICRLFTNEDALAEAGFANRLTFERLHAFDQMSAYEKLFHEIKHGIRVSPLESNEMARTCLTTLSMHALCGAERLKKEIVACHKRIKQEKRKKRRAVRLFTLWFIITVGILIGILIWMLISK